jgi:CTP:molybdopterin cytidylyltransferase MocA
VTHDATAARPVRVAGVLLAAGAGRRMGRPKALVELDGEPLVRHGVRGLLDAGLAPVVVVLGAEAAAARALLPVDPRLEVVTADGWAEGMGASLRAGLEALRAQPDVDAALVSLVDVPGIGAAALRRVAGAATGPHGLARGAFDGRPGHPVLLGREHWDAVVAAARGDEGARSFLRGRDDVAPVEVGDVAVRDDLDTPQDVLARRTPRPR